MRVLSSRISHIFEMLLSLFKAFIALSFLSRDFIAALFELVLLLTKFSYLDAY